MSTHVLYFHRLFCTSGFLILIASLTSCDFLPDLRPSGPLGKNPDVTVMTRNLYLGTDFNVLLGASTPEDVPARVAEFFGNVQATNFPERAAALADEIESADPQLIGLQEVALYRSQSPSDYLTGHTGPNAMDVELDFLAILQSELAARGLPYRIVNESVNVDAELPAARSATEFFDLRLTLRNVILARPNVRTTASETGMYEAVLQVPIGGATASFTRSYGWISAVVAGVPFRFVNTHLETEAAPPIQQAQAGELVDVLRDVEGPVILVGDFNSAADGSTTKSYALLTDRFTDAYASANPGRSGYTCCQSGDLLNSDSMLDRRIDLILYRGDADATSARRVGESREDRTPSGLWPSDHAGVKAKIRLERTGRGKPDAKSADVEMR